LRQSPESVRSGTEIVTALELEGLAGCKSLSLVVLMFGNDAYSVIGKWEEMVAVLKKILADGNDKAEVEVRHTSWSKS